MKNCEIQENINGGCRWSNTIISNIYYLKTPIFFDWQSNYIPQNSLYIYI